MFNTARSPGGPLGCVRSIKCVYNKKYDHVICISMILATFHLDRKSPARDIGLILSSKQDYRVAE